MRETKDIEMNSLAVECEDCMSTHKIAVYITFADPVSYREAEQYVTERLSSMLQSVYVVDRRISMWNAQWISCMIKLLVQWEYHIARLGNQEDR